MESSDPPPGPSETPKEAVSDNVATSEKRRRQPRNSACQQCAALKMKCVANEDGGKCERCQRMGRDCVPAIPKPRKRRAGEGDFSSPSGVPLASFMNGSVTKNAGAHDASLPKIDSRPWSGSAPPTAAPLFKPSAREPNIHARLLPESTSSTAAPLFRPDIRHNESQSFAALFAQGLGLSELPRELVIDYNYVNNFFLVFRQFATHFPFIHTFLGVDAVKMVAERPFTTAAVCTVTSSLDPSAQERLSHLFRAALAAKALVEGERNVDMMVGLLIYLAWHHHYIVKPQIYQYLCLLAGMTTDLGLHRHLPQLHNEEAGLAIERDRAFLGAYYLSINLAAKGVNKPSPFRWTDNLRRCAESVARSEILPSDKGLISMMELSYINDDLENRAFPDLDAKRSTVDIAYELHAKSGLHHLRTLKRDHPSLSNHPAFTAAMINVQYKLLSASDATDTSALFQCACLIKEYLDELLSQPPITLHQTAITHWTNLLSILVMLVKVSKPLPNNVGWESGALTTMLQPVTCLGSLYAHMASAPVADPLSPRHENLTRLFWRFCEHLKQDVENGASATNGVYSGGIDDEGVLDIFMRQRRLWP